MKETTEWRKPITIYDTLNNNSGHGFISFLTKSIIIGSYNINATTIKQIPVRPQKDFVKINFCFKGRCELKTNEGEYIYMTAGQIATDYGQTISTFFYPTAEYEGIEILLVEPYEDTLFHDVISNLIYKIKNSNKQFIIQAPDHLKSTFSLLSNYIGTTNSLNLSLVKTLEILLLLDSVLEHNINKNNSRHNFCTQSQVAIAKEVRCLIENNLETRYTAEYFALKYNVSDTTIKNYFRYVYGIGFKEFQIGCRMEKAEKELFKGKKIIDISRSVGYSSQSKFTDAFKAFYGITPLEYRRRKKLELES